MYFLRNLLLIASLLWLALCYAAGQAIPKLWDQTEVSSFELPLVYSERSPKHVSTDYYYRIPVRPIYRSYPIYAPGKEPLGYMKWLEAQEPEIVFDAAKVHSDEDWVKAGELVFGAPIGYGASFKLSQVRDKNWYTLNRIPTTKDGIMPFSRYVVRTKGTVEVGSGGCLMCHARLMPDGKLLKGAQGNFPVDRVIGYNLRQQVQLAADPNTFLRDIRRGQRAFFSVPWLKPDPIDRIDNMSLEDIAAVYAAIPPGVTTRVNLSLFVPAQIPSLIGVGDLRHLDHTGIVIQRSIADLMRYIALVQGANSFDRFGDFGLFAELPDPAHLDRYSDEQLYALSRFLYSLKPPANPNKLDSTATRGKQVFFREGCNVCHTPPLYTSNKLTPAAGFTPPPEHYQRYGILNRSVETDPELAMRTRKGTGYYKVPSLRGLWYRGPFQHGGAAKSLEEWFDPTRYTRIPGHPFGLRLDSRDRSALIRFLKTL
jgi:hypothetical protein